MTQVFTIIATLLLIISGVQSADYEDHIKSKNYLISAIISLILAGICYQFKLY